MIVLGIDPGATTGWVVYDTNTRGVTARGEFAGYGTVMLCAHQQLDVVALERLVPHGASYPQVVEAAYVAGRIVGQFQVHVRELTRADVRRILQDATHGAVKVRDDKSVWSALLLIHGGESAGEKGGALYGVKSHERAALAVAVAWAIKNEGNNQ